MEVKKLFGFDGRVGRGEYWGIGIANAILGGAVWAVATGGNNALITLLAVVVAVATLVVGLATNVKRWHDRDKSGAWVLIGLVPIIGSIWSFIELGFLPGTPGANEYGLPGSGSVRYEPEPETYILPTRFS